MYYGQVYGHNVNNDYEALEDGALDELANGYYASGSRDKRSYWLISWVIGRD